MTEEKTAKTATKKEETKTTTAKKTRSGPLVAVKTKNGKVIKMTKDEYHQKLHKQRQIKKQLKEAYEANEE